MLKQIPGTLGPICLALLVTSLVTPLVAAADDEVVISDGPVTITHDEFAEILASTPDKMRNAAARDRGDRFALINELVINRKLVAEAEKVGPDDPGYRDLQSRLDKVKQEFAFKRALAEYELPDLEALAKERYKTHKDQYATIPETRASSHILLAQAPGPDRRALREKAQRILEELRAGADFEAYVEEYSGDPGSSKRGGSLDKWIRFGDPGITPPYSEALFAIDEVGGYSEVTDSQFGVHIIRLDGIRESGYKPYKEVRGAIMEDLIAEHRKLASKAVSARFGITDDAFVDGDALEELFAPYQ